MRKTFHTTIEIHMAREKQRGILKSRGARTLVYEYNKLVDSQYICLVYPSVVILPVFSNCPSVLCVVDLSA